MTPLGVELLSRQGNYTVLRSPGRSFPGIHIAGDSFSILVDELRELAAETVGAPEAHEHAQELAEDLEGILGAYETALAEHGIRPVYFPSQPARTTVDLASGWLAPGRLRSFLELTSGYVGYEFDDSDWLAITTALDQEGTVDYPLVGKTPLTARLEIDEADHIIVTITGQPELALRIRLTTLFDALTTRGPGQVADAAAAKC
ncbi:hypothetical protein AB0F91_27625 [Amycolatopsis sp. NPDC023774]|uniref:DUF6959 family protein n=1 Tax=Amycolatopsis sp. NPDC023774 TaxID=3155015 RepID=UPI0033D1F2AB